MAVVKIFKITDHRRSITILWEVKETIFKTGREWEGTKRFLFKLKTYDKYITFFFSNVMKNQPNNGDISMANGLNSQHVHPWPTNGQISALPPPYFLPGTDSSMPFNGKYFVAPTNAMTRQNNPCGNQYQQFQYPQVPYFPFNQPAAVQQ